MSNDDFFNILRITQPCLALILPTEGRYFAYKRSTHLCWINHDFVYK